MKILLVTATRFEIQPALDYIQTHVFEQERAAPDLLITGVGAVATTYHLTKYLRTAKPELIIQAGIAGSFHQEVALGTVFFVEEETFGDMGVIESGNLKDLFDLGLMQQNEAPFTGKILKNPFLDLVKDEQLASAKSIGISEISTSPGRIDALSKKYNPDVESMEGAAFHYVCLQEKIPFLQIRAVSNYVGERDKTKWDLKTAVHHLNEKLVAIIRRLC